MNVRAQFERLFNNEMSQEEGRLFLMDLSRKGETFEDIAAGAAVMREHSIKLPLSNALRQKAIDVVGTGGDKIGSFNISSTVSLLLASLGCMVAKHGSRNVTSVSGAADVLEALGINLDLSVENQMKMLEETGFCFIFAMNHHPAMKHIMPIRKSIDYHTIFNILGPLSSPAGARKYLLGVFDPSHVKRIADALLELDTIRALVVSSHDGMDEISLACRTSFAYLENNRILEGEINPEALGFNYAPKEAILGGNAHVNAQIARDIFSGKEQGAKRDIVVLNAAFALFVEGNVRDIQEAIVMAKEAIDSKKALAHLDKIVKMSQQLSDEIKQ
jgi:anthranilate phosphoribosyltransferase